MPLWEESSGNVVRLAELRILILLPIFYEVQILVINDTSMLNKQMPSTVQGKCLDSQNVFTKNFKINWEASTNQWYKQWVESKDGPSYMFLWWYLFCVIIEFSYFLWIFEEEDYWPWRNNFSLNAIFQLAFWWRYFGNWIKKRGHG